MMLGQVDTFQDGTAHSWFTGGGPGGTPPTSAAVLANGGPAGAGDSYIQLTAHGGAGPGSRLNVMNATQWAGDYLAVGVTAVGIDLNNFGATDLLLRLGLFRLDAGVPTDIAFTTDAVFLPGGSGWVQRRFNLRPGDLTAYLGSVEQALRGATALLLFHSPAPNFPNPGLDPIPAIVANLGVDNIRAVPEPSSALLLGASLLVLIGRARVLSGSRSWLGL